MDVKKASIAYHKKYRGKIEINAKVPLKDIKEMGLAYTPGVGAVCMEINKNPKKYAIVQKRNNLPLSIVPFVIS